MAGTRRKKVRKKVQNPTRNREEDTALVLTTVALAVLSFVTLVVALMKFLQWAPGIVALEAVIAIAIFAAVVGRALIARANSTPERYRASAPVLTLSMRRHRAR